MKFGVISLFLYEVALVVKLMNFNYTIRVNYCLWTVIQSSEFSKYTVIDLITIWKKPTKKSNTIVMIMTTSMLTMERMIRKLS